MFQTEYNLSYLKKMQVLLKTLTYEGQEIQVQINIEISSVLFINQFPHSRKNVAKSFAKNIRNCFFLFSVM